jgi:hypothetical protein
LGTAYWSSKAFLTACDLKLFGLVEGGAGRPEAVARALLLSERGVRFLMDGMAALGLLAKDGGHYRTTPLSSAYLVEGKPGYMGDLFIAMNRLFYAPFAGLEQALREGRPVWPVDADGRRVPLAAGNSELFTRGMHGLSAATGQAFGRKWSHRLAGKHHLLDLGGGSGAMSIGAVEHTPGLLATVLDRPTPCTVARETVAAAGLSQRIATLERDLFDDPYPNGPDVHLYSNVFQNYEAWACRGLLKKSFDSLPPGGELIIAEFVLAEDRTSPPFAAAFNFLALVASEAGETHTYGEYRRWLEEAGFVDVGHSPLRGPTSLVFASKPLP